MVKSDFPFTIDDVALNLLGLRTSRGLPSNTAASYRVLCPFCTSKHYSLDIVRNKDIWSCQACGNSGGVLDLYRKVKYGEYTSMTNGEAYKEILQLLSMDTYAPVYQHANVKPIEENETRSPKEIHMVYAKMLKMPYFNLKKEHKDNLLSRGLSCGQIIEKGYRSSPSAKYAYMIAKELIDAGFDLHGIPGFFLDDGKLYNKIRQDFNKEEILGYTPGQKNWVFKYWPEGFYIPIRNARGYISSIQIRTKNPQAKYVFMSSSNEDNGCKALSCAHFSGNFIDMPEVVYLTEGPLKADIATALSGKAFVALPGISTYKAMESALRVLKKMGVVTVVEAFDMDRYTNENVKKAVKNLRKMVDAAGFEYEVLKWDETYKGIDDYLLQKKRPGL